MQLAFSSSDEPYMTFHSPYGQTHKISIFLPLSKRDFGAALPKENPLPPKQPACTIPFVSYSNLTDCLQAWDSWQVKPSNASCKSMFADQPIIPSHPSPHLALRSCPRGGAVAHCHTSVPSDCLHPNSYPPHSLKAYWHEEMFLAPRERQALGSLWCLNNLG